MTNSKAGPRARKAGAATVDRGALAGYLDCLLDVPRYADHCPNGVQVEGKARIASIVSGVTACAALLDAAIEARADAVLVHHGYFWRGEDPRVVGQLRGRLRRLLAHDINLFAYHLPLDGHAELGNNAQLALRLGLVREAGFGEQNLASIGHHARAKTVGELARVVARALGRKPAVIGAPERRIARIGWCTGGAQSMLAAAIAAGCDAYLSGEISEQTTHLAREAGVAYFACGHHATERYGVAALGAHVAARFGIAHRFVDIDNPA